MSEQHSSILQVYLQEYDKLKFEQAKRIGFRDNILYVTLGLFGGILSFAFAENNNYYSLLCTPWICLILGWTYLVNDEKISAIGKYIRSVLVENIRKETGSTDADFIFAWETTHRTDRFRVRRKVEQLSIDEITFVVSGMVSLSAFWLLASNIPTVIYILSGIEFLLLLILGLEIIAYADLT